MAARETSIATGSATGEIRVLAVRHPRDLARFVRLPEMLYRNDPAWVPPLRLERRHFLSPANPYFAHAEWAAWLALRGDTPVGRISAQIDRLYTARDGIDTGFFGCFEAAGREVAEPLFLAAESWLREHGIRRVRGPFSLSINQECGLLVEGFGTPPMVMMGHAQPWYGPALAGLGYENAMDLLAFRVRPDFDPPPTMRALLHGQGQKFRVRSIDRRRFGEDLAAIREVFNDAWSANWGFIPFTEAEFAELGQTLRYLVDPGFIQLAEIDGRVVAMIVALPNVNEAQRDLRGRLLPFGWAKLLWRLKVRHPRTARVALMGVLREYQHRRLGSALAFAVIDAVRQVLYSKGVRTVEMSWILETNKGMRSIIEAIGGEPYKRYRIYEKSLTDQVPAGSG